MEIIRDLFSSPPCPPEARKEVQTLLNELFRIGKEDDFLSERPGPPFNGQCRHIRARAIGKRLSDIGGLPLMDFVHFKVRRKCGALIAGHLEYAWDGIGVWKH
jgi:hypothetical protein